MTAPRDAYSRAALAQVPRILSLQDRNPLSSTFGSFDRRYWLDKTEDFVDALPQFGSLSLAKAYAHRFPDNPFYRKDKVLQWTLAGMDYWARVQHKDGSFDEFYPYERGWVGPTAFTTYAMIDALQTLGDAVPAARKAHVLEAARKAARFIAKGESEEDKLANHHAMAVLAMQKAVEAFPGEKEFLDGYESILAGFLTYHRKGEGWSVEYDGTDPGYLSATVSFLGKAWKTNADPRLASVIEESAIYASHFAYPNGYYAGSLGSRNTLHFYPHGFELLAGKVPRAMAVAEHLLGGLDQGTLVPPAIMADRYLFYRVPELMDAWIDYAPRAATLDLLPWQQEGYRGWHPGPGTAFATSRTAHVAANLDKGGVVKVFDLASRKLVYNDAGIIGKLDDGRVVTSQWIAGHAREGKADDWNVRGKLNVVPSNKPFTPVKNMVFRGTLVTLGWYPPFSHWLKGKIRRMLMLGTRPVGVSFERTMRFDGGNVVVKDVLRNDAKLRFADLMIGDEFFVRYVPQSRYFQLPELDAQGWRASPEVLAKLNAGGSLVVERRVAQAGGAWETTTAVREE